MKINVLQDITSFQHLEKNWNELVENSGDKNVFLTWDWQYEWWLTYGVGKQLYIITIYEGDQLIGILPSHITIEKIFPGVPRVKFLKFMGTGEVYSDFLDVIVVPDYKEKVAKLLSSYFREPQPWNILELSDVLGNASIAGVKSYLSSEELMWSAEGGVCPGIEFNDNWDDFLASLSKKMRYEVRSDRRKLDKVGEIEHYTVTDSADLSYAMAEFERLHQDRFVKKGEKGVFVSQAYTQFHNNVARRLLERGWLNLVFIRVDGINVACRYQFIYKERIFDYLPGLDTNWYKHSVGMVQLSHCVENAIKRGCHRYEFLRGDESYKYRWKAVDQHLYTLRMASNNVRSKSLFLVLRIKAFLKAFIKSLIPAEMLEYIKSIMR